VGWTMVVVIVPFIRLIHYEESCEVANN